MATKPDDIHPLDPINLGSGKVPFVPDQERMEYGEYQRFLKHGGEYAPLKDYAQDFVPDRQSPSMSDAYIYANAPSKPQEFWQPWRVGRYHQAFQALPPENNVPPEAIDNIGSVYAQLQARNRGTPWYEWESLPEDDPYKEILNTLPLPPPEMMRGDERGNNWFDPNVSGGIVSPSEYGIYLVPEDKALEVFSTDQLLDFNRDENGNVMIPRGVVDDILKQSAGQQAQTPQYVPPGEMPEQVMGMFTQEQWDNMTGWERWYLSNPEVSGLVSAGLTGAVVGGLAGGPAGAVIGAGTFGVLGFAAQRIPLLQQVLLKLDVGAETLERAMALIGMGYAEGIEGGADAVAEYLNTLLKYPKETWQAGSLMYEGSFANVTSEQVRGWGEYWTPPNGEIASTWAVREAKRRLIAGESFDEVYADISSKFGVTGQIRDLIGHIALDPINFFGEVSTTAGKGIAKLGGKENLAKAFDIADSRLFMVPREYARIIGQEVPLAQRQNMGSIAKWMANLTPTGEAIVSLPKGEKSGWKIPHPYDYLTPESKYHQMMNDGVDGIAILLDPENDAGRIVKIVKNIAGTDPKTAAKAIDDLPQYQKYYDSAEAAIVPMSIRDTVPKVQELYDNFLNTRQAYDKLLNAANGTGVDLYKMISNLHKGNLDTAMDVLRQIQDTTGTKIENLDVEAVTLKKFADMFTAKDGPPLDVNMFKAQVMATLESGVDAFATKWYGIKPPSLIGRWNAVIKRAQGKLVLGVNPTYVFNNVGNNVVTIGWDGLLRLSTKEQDLAWMREVGINPKRVDIEALTGYIKGEEMGGKAFREARKASPSDLAQKILDAKDPTEKLMLAMWASSKNEKAMGGMAYVTAMKEFLNKRWVAGDGFDRMDADTRTVLDGYQPGLVDKVERGIARGLTKEKIEKIVFKDLGKASINDVITPDEKVLLGKFPRVLNELELNIKKAQTPEDMRTAIRNAKSDMQTEISERIARNIGDMAREAAEKSFTEGLDGSFKILDDVMLSHGDMMMQHFKNMDDLFAKVEGVTGWERQIILDEGLRQASVDWNNLENINGAKILGVIRGLGTDGDVVLAEKALFDIHDAYNYLYNERAKRMYNYYEQSEALQAQVSKGLITGEFATSERSRIYREIQDGLNQLYKDAVTIEYESQAQIDSVFGDLMAGKFPGGREGIMAWRQNMLNARKAQTDAMTYFRTGEGDLMGAMDNPLRLEVDKILKGRKMLDLSLAERDVAWKAYKEKVYMPLIKQQMDAAMTKEGLPPVVRPPEAEAVKAPEGEQVPEAPVEAPITITPEQLKALVEERAAKLQGNIQNMAANAPAERFGRNSFMEFVTDHFGKDTTKAEAVIKITDQIAKDWAQQYGKRPDDWYETFGTRRGGEANIEDQLYQRVNNLYEKDLIALHNTNASDLISADKLGGMPVPSLAIKKAGQPFDSYGEITFVGNKTMIDPAAKYENRIFSADVYSPTAPDMVWKKIPINTARKVIEPIDAAAKDIGDWSSQAEIFDLMVEHPDYYRALQVLEKSDAGRVAFLRTKGVDVEPVVIDLKLRFPFANETAFKKWLLNNAEKITKSEYKSTATDEITAQVKKMAKAQSKAIKEPDLERIYLDRFLNEDGNIGGAYWNMIKDDADALLYKRTEIDRGSTTELINKKFNSELNLEYQEWAKNLLSVFKEPELKLRGKKVAYTLVNIVDAMTTKPIRAAEETMTYGPGKARAASAEELVSIEDMHKREGALVTREQVQSFINEQQKPIMDEFQATFRDKYFRGTGFNDVWDALNEMYRALADYLKGGKKVSPDRMKTALSRSGFKHFNDSDLQKAVDAAEILRNTPTEYFEAKPQRPVYFDEWTAAVIPDNASKEVIDILKKRGVNYNKYISGDDADRLAKIGSYYKEQDVLFQLNTDVVKMITANLGDKAVTKAGLLNDKYVINIVKKYGGDAGAKITKLDEITPELMKKSFDARSIANGGTPLTAEGKVVLGATEWLESGKALMTAMEDANPYTFIHEVVHMRTPTLPIEDIRIIEGWLKDTHSIDAPEGWHLKLKGRTDVETAAWEKLARGFEEYQAKGIAPTEGLRAVFQKMKLWALEVYHSITGSDIDVKISDDMQAMFDRWMGEAGTEKKIAAMKQGVDTLGNRPVGKMTTAMGVDPNNVYNMRYRIVDLDELITSNTPEGKANPLYPKELQPRARDRVAGKTQINKIASELNADALLTDSKALDRGPMIIGADLVVESGNGRTLALKQALEKHPDLYREYVDMLNKNLADYGFDQGTLEGINNPVLVRERIGDINRVDFTREANQSAVMQFSDLEKAKIDAGYITDRVLKNLDVGDAGLEQTLRSGKNMDIVREFVKSMPETERATIMDAEGMLNQRGIQRLRDALFAKVYPGEAGARMLQLFSESAEPAVQNVRSAVYDSLPQISQIEGLIATGQREAGLSIYNDIAQAVDKYARLKQERMPISDYLAQTSFLEPELLDFGKQILGFINEYGRSRKVLRDTFRGYSEQVLKQPDPRQIALIEGMQTVNKESLFAQAVDVASKGEYDMLADQAQTALFQASPKSVWEGKAKGTDEPLFQASRPDTSQPEGTFDEYANMPIDQATHELWTNHISDILDRAETKLTSTDGYRGDLNGLDRKLDPDTQVMLKKYLSKTYSQLNDTKMGATRWGEARRDFSLLNYQKRFGFDNVVGGIFPYQFWYTRTMLNWAQRLLTQPHIMKDYVLLKRFIDDRVENDGFPFRLKQKLSAYMPFLPAWMGEGVFVDPMRQLFPFEQITQPFDRMVEQKNMEERKAEGFVYNMIEQEEVGQDVGMEAIQTHAGPTWEAAVAKARNEIDADIRNPADFAMAMSSPSLPLGIAYNMSPFGRKDRISQLPITRLIQNTTAAAGVGGPRGVNIEAGIRKATGLPEMDRFEDYRVDRMLANLAAEGKYPVDEIRRAMIERQGPAFIDAQRRVSQMGLWTYVGAPIGVDFFPEGEQKQRQLSEEYTNAITAWKAGDSKALVKFFDTYPEYQARMDSFKEPEERLRNFLRSEIWDKYLNGPEVYQKQAQEQLGDVFTDAFLDKETRSYDSISTETFAAWAQMLGSQLPKGTDAPTISLKLAPEKVATQVEDYRAEVKKLFPDVGDLNKMYYALPMEQQDLFKQQYPQVAEYEKYRNKYLATHPDTIAWLISEDNELWGLPTSVQQKVYDYRATRDEKYPNIFETQNRYYDIAETDKDGRATFRKQHPELEEYWDWRRDFAAKNTKAAPYILSDESLAGSITGENITVPPQLQPILDQYYKTKETMFPNISDKWDDYFKLDKAGKKEYWNAHPELKEYIDWQQMAAATIPDIAPYILSDKKLSEMIMGGSGGSSGGSYTSNLDPALMRSLFAKAYGTKDIGTGAYKELKDLWISAGKPTKTLDEFIEMVAAELKV